MYRTSQIRRSGMSLLLFAAFAAGVIYFGFDLAGGVARGAPVVTTGSPGDAAAAARSGGVRWGPSRGPEGGPALALAVAPSAPEIVYVGTGRGVFRSMNGGRSWASAGLAQPPGPDGSSPPGVTSLAVDPRTPTTVYAGLNDRWDGGTTYRHPVFKSTNGGRTWRALGLRGQVVAITPTEPPTVYAAAGGSGGTSRLFRSTDGGRNWQAADRGLPSTYLWALTFDPTSPATVYAAMGRRGVFESSDSGGSWHTLGVSPAYREVTAIAVDPRHPHTVYAGTDAGVIKSLDGGRSWRMVNAAMGSHGRDRGYGQVWALVVDPRDSRTVYATTRCTGVLKSTDGGHRWSPANTGLEPMCTGVRSRARSSGSAEHLRGRFRSRRVQEPRRRRALARDKRRSQPVDGLLACRRPTETRDRLRGHEWARPLQEQRRRRPLAGARIRSQARRRDRARPEQPSQHPRYRRGVRDRPEHRRRPHLGRGKPRRPRTIGECRRDQRQGGVCRRLRSRSLRELGRRTQLARTRRSRRSRRQAR